MQLAVSLQETTCSAEMIVNSHASARHIGDGVVPDLHSNG